MAKKKKHSKKKRSKDEKQCDHIEVIRSALAVIVTLIERIGWPGTFVFFMMWLIINSSQDQQERIVEKYILGTNIKSDYLI